MSLPCFRPVVPSPPTLPSGFDFLVPPLPGLPDLTLCCQIHYEDYLPSIPPLPYSIPLTIAQVAVINTALATAQKAVQDYIDSMIPECPKL